MSTRASKPRHPEVRETPGIRKGRICPKLDSSAHLRFSDVSLKADSKWRQDDTERRTRKDLDSNPRAEAPTLLEARSPLRPPNPISELVLLGSELAKAIAPSVPARHLSDHTCPEPTVPPLGSTPEGRITGQLHKTKPVHNLGYTTLNKEVDLHP